MDFTRNHYFLLGLVILFLGLELLYVDSVTLTPEFTMFLAKQTNHPITKLQIVTDSLAPDSETSIPPKTFSPPEWSGWLMVSLGSVLVLHSLAMKKPGG